MAVEKSLTSIEDFEAFIDLPENQNRRFELLHGEIIEKMPTEEHGFVASNIHGWMFIFLQQNDIGRLTIEPRHKLPQDDQNSLLPDIAFTHYERALPLVERGAVPQMPDLAIEIKSPDDSYRQMRDRAEYYLANGSLMVWLFYNEKRLIEVCHGNGEIDILGDGDILDGGDVLPGFKVEVSKLFKPKK